VDKLSFCAEPGCTFIATNSRFCPAHTGNNYQSHRNRHPWYARRIWRSKIRPMKLARNPICEGCGLRPATDVHHIDESWKVNEDWPLFLGGVDLQNLRSLCHECHSAITLENNRKKGSL
jgi:5-methylcytosine-specific restriction endonuclease McrA